MKGTSIELFTEFHFLCCHRKRDATRRSGDFFSPSLNKLPLRNPIGAAATGGRRSPILLHWRSFKLSIGPNHPIPLIISLSTTQYPTLRNSIPTTQVLIICQFGFFGPHLVESALPLLPRNSVPSGLWVVTAFAHENQPPLVLRFFCSLSPNTR